jgi:hypothetical protein
MPAAAKVSESVIDAPEFWRPTIRADRPSTIDKTQNPFRSLCRSWTATVSPGTRKGLKLRALRFRESDAVLFQRHSKLDEV